MTANSDQVFIIAEAGVNHTGSLSRALEMVDVAATAGVDAIKFQTFIPEALASRSAPKAEYQQRNTTGQESQLEMLKQLSLTNKDHHTLLEHCKKKGIQFLSSPFDLASADFLLYDLNLPLIKLGSGEITNGPLLHHIAKSGRGLILSTGMSNLKEIKQALAVLAFGYLEPDIEPDISRFTTTLQSKAGKQILRDKVSLLHCTTEYPCPAKEVNLRAMNLLHDHFGLTVGYSDHTEGLTASLAAVARDAKIIEKHFTLDRNLPGPDHKSSLEPQELGELVHSIRIVESTLGKADKKATPSEIKNAKVARKSLVAACPIQKGNLYSRENLTCKRPASGHSPMEYWRLLGQPANRDYAEDEPIDP